MPKYGDILLGVALSLISGITAVAQQIAKPEPSTAHKKLATIENPKNLPVRNEEVSLLYTMVCEQVAQDFHVRNDKNLEVPLTLVLGEERERYIIDHLTGEGTIYLQQWNEIHFASAAVMIAFHHVLTDGQFQAEVKKVVTRFSKIAPETVTAASNRQ